ncbi:hypothetical protein [Halorientalis persicus]|nr:hypothetical protein [Halorientalis persicus]
MGGHETPSGREANSQKGRDYADAVIRFMDSRGYICTDRAEVSGSGTDLKFKPKVSGRPIIAEAKHRGQNQQGLSPKKYKEGFAEYFIRWVENPEYEFHFFISNEANGQLWRRLFRQDPDSETVREYFEELQEDIAGETGEELSKYTVETFEDFAADTTVWNWDYVELVREADRAERTGDLDYEPYLTPYSPIKDGQGKLHTNFFEVTNLPSTVYRFAVQDGVSPSSFYGRQMNRHAPVALYEGMLYSLLPQEDLPDAAADATDGGEDQLSFVEFSDRSDDDSKNWAKSLLEGLLAFYARENGAVVGERHDGRVTLIYMPLSDGGNHGKERKVGRRWLAKEADRHPVVRHRAIEVDVKRFAGRYYYAFSPKQEFTEDGRTLVDPAYKDKLSDDFSQSRYPQNARKRGNIEAWAEVLDPQESLMAYGAAKPIQELEFEQVRDIETNCRPPSDGDERTELIERQ